MTSVRISSRPRRSDALAVWLLHAPFDVGDARGSSADADNAIVGIDLEPHTASLIQRCRAIPHGDVPRRRRLVCMSFGVSSLSEHVHHSRSGRPNAKSIRGGDGRVAKERNACEDIAFDHHQHACRRARRSKFVARGRIGPTSCRWICIVPHRCNYLSSRHADAKGSKSIGRQKAGVAT